MIQAGGYGQAYGAGGGMAFGAAAYGAQRESVLFQRYVEQEKLNIEKRRLSQQAAQAAANRKLQRDLANQQYDLQQQKMNFEMRRLEMAEQQRVEQMAINEQRYMDSLAYRERQMDLAERRMDLAEQRAYDSYDAQLARLQNELDAKTAKSEFDIIKAGGIPLDEYGSSLEEDGYVPYTDASGRQYKVPVRGAGGDVGNVTEADRLLVKNRSDELASLEKEIASERKELAGMEKSVEDAEAALAEAARGQQESKALERDAAQEKYSAAQKSLEGKRLQLEAGRAYLDKSIKDANLESDVGWLQWKSLPWAGTDAYTPEQSGFMMELLQSNDANDRDMLRALVARGGEKFDLDAAKSYREGNDKAKETIPAVSWMGVDWEGLTNSDEAARARKMQELMRKGDLNARQVNALADGVNALLGDGYRMFQVPKGSYQKEEQPLETNSKGYTIERYEIDEGDNGRGLVVYERGVPRTLLTLEQWNTLNDQQKVKIMETLAKRRQR